MATLMFSTAGTMLGGPVGGAIGSLIGQSLDQQWLGGGPKRGPRVGDLSVQTSTYGTPIPRIYGTMRVAGTVVWATDLKEGSTYVGGKGQPETIVYNYTVSLAVALSSRSAVRVKRIWADGKLMRGEAGDFKVGTEFRFYPGTEDQQTDPLIATVEGVDVAPAYRGLALAVFENLELAEYGNRIPFLTFEVEGDEQEATIGNILEDATFGLIPGEDERTVDGFAAYGATQAEAIEPLLRCFNAELFEDGAVLRTAMNPLFASLRSDELGCSSDGERRDPIERRKAASQEAPASVAIEFYDLSRDFQAGRARASLGDNSRPELAVDAPIACDPATAKRIAQDLLTRSCARRERVTVAIGPRWMGLRPGDALSVPGLPGVWQVDRCSIEEMAVIAELHPRFDSAGDLPADGGRSSKSLDQVSAPTVAALFDLPSLPGSGNNALIQIATASPGPGWKPVGLEVEMAGTGALLTSAARQSILGHATSVLPPGECYLRDDVSSVEIQLVDQDAWLTSCDAADLARGANVAALGDELFQFGAAEATGPGRFRLSQLLRGRRGSEWAVGSHRLGEPFLLLLPGTVRTVEVPLAAIGALVSVRPLGIADHGSEPIAKLFNAESLRPPSPVRLSVARGSSGSLELSWVRRSRTGWEWLDGVDTPLGESRELYRVTLTGPAKTIELETSIAALSVPPDTIASLGSGPLRIELRQAGDHALSHPAIVESLLL